MADKQSEALRLADALETPAIEAGAFKHEVVAELRRLAGIEAERDALRVDAERYRWLRSARDENFWHCHEKDGYGGQILMYGVDLDAAIDAAIDAAMKGGGK